MTEAAEPPGSRSPAQAEAASLRGTESRPLSKDDNPRKALGLPLSGQCSAAFGLDRASAELAGPGPPHGRGGRPTKRLQGTSTPLQTSSASKVHAALAAPPSLDPLPLMSQGSGFDACPHHAGPPEGQTRGRMRSPQLLQD